MSLTALTQSSQRLRSASLAPRDHDISLSAPWVPSSSTTYDPRKPAPPVTRTRLPVPERHLSPRPTISSGTALQELVPLAYRLQPSGPHVRVHHDLDQSVELDLEVQAEPVLRLRRVRDELVDLGRPEVPPVDLDMLLRLQTSVLERLVHELLDRVRLARAEDEIVPASSAAVSATWRPRTQGRTPSPSWPSGCPGTRASASPP